MRALQAKLLARKHVYTGKPLSVKTVKNIIIGSLRAMIREAMADELVTRDIFVGLTWPKRDLPEPDPFGMNEVRRILGWFATKQFRFAAVAGSMGIRRLPHPAFHGYVHILFMAGLRPSEASGLQWQDVDLQRGLIYVRRSYHLYGYNPPKTRSARRTVELLPESVRILRALQPLHVAPEHAGLHDDGRDARSSRRRSPRTGTGAFGSRHPGARALLHEGHLRVAGNDSRSSSCVAGGADRRQLGDAQDALRAVDHATG